MTQNMMRLIVFSACLGIGTPAVAVETAAATDAADTHKDTVRTADAAGATVPEQPPEGTAAVLATAEQPVYVPPRRGAPKTRVGGGTRSGGASLHVALLAPEQTGLTGKPSPTLYWWLSAEHSGPVELVVTASDEVVPVLRVRPASPVAAGIHALDLAAAGVALKPGVSYRWSVAVIRDEANRARDVVASAMLEYAPDKATAGDANALAAAGLWYDALDALTGSDAERPKRAALLDQVALSEVAAWERSGS